MPAMPRYDTFDAYAAAQPAHARPLIDRLRVLVAEVAPELTESVKWGNGCWLDVDRPVAYVHTEADHVQFGFFGGAHLDDPDGLLAGKGKHVRHVRVDTAADAERDSVAALLRRAVSG
ncbi:DUF1801 domain-containing protein [Nocardioides limicola]|uniref:DUF1801 domain-containing protein n=1 Tax=Nocardioides limicola TaxID=2803368 RepID=UPI00193C0B52|nr:DUF1801 domain-containing protein [Nocardioides sp. DJM-14]